MADLEHLGHVELLDSRSSPVPFRSLWAASASLLCFVRQFGCIFCHQQAAQLLDGREQFEAMGVTVNFIGNGNPVDAAEFMTRIGLERGVYTDPARLLYDRLGMLHGVWRTINVKSRRHVRAAEDQGFQQTGVAGHRWQMGGCLLVRQGGELSYQYNSMIAGDHPSLALLLDEAARLKATG